MSEETTSKPISRYIGRGGLLLKKYSPEILLGAGIVGVVAAFVLAIKATKDNKEELEQSSNDFNYALKTIGEHYKKDDPDRYKYLGQETLTLALDYAKVYAPPVGLLTGSLIAIVGSHGIMKNRTASIMAAYALLQEGFMSYRKNVVNELGEEKDRDFRLGIHEEDVVVREATEKRKAKTEKQKVRNPNAHSDYAVFFDEYSVYWRRNANENMYFLKLKENWLNDQLQARGHVFLNEVYDELGIPRTKAGAAVGWVLDSKEGGDGYIDLGIYVPENGAFVNGYEESVLLDPNVDGPIWDLI